MKIMQRRVEEARFDDHVGPRVPQRHRLILLIEGMW
jgi:hypothetical protein